MRGLVLVLLVTGGCTTCADLYPSDNVAREMCYERGRKDANDWAKIVDNSMGSGAHRDDPKTTKCTSHRELNGDVTTTCK